MHRSRLALFAIVAVVAIAIQPKPAKAEIKITLRSPLSFRFVPPPMPIYAPMPGYHTVGYSPVGYSPMQHYQPRPVPMMRTIPMAPRTMHAGNCQQCQQLRTTRAPYVWYMPIR